MWVVCHTYVGQRGRLFSSLCHVEKQPNEVVKSTEVGIGCPCRSTKVRMGESCRRRVEVEAIQAWRQEQACSGGLRKVPVVGPELVVGHDATVEGACLVVRWVVAVVGTG